MEIKTEAKAYLVDLQCKKCKSVMHNTGRQSTLKVGNINQISLLHKCVNKDCNHSEWIRGKSYPTIKFESIGKSEEIKK